MRLGAAASLNFPHVASIHCQATKWLITGNFFPDMWSCGMRPHFPVGSELLQSSWWRCPHSGHQHLQAQHSSPGASSPAQKKRNKSPWAPWYPLVNSHITMEKSPCFMGKSTISMAIFNSKLLVYQRVVHLNHPTPQSRNLLLRVGHSHEDLRKSIFFRWMGRLAEVETWLIMMDSDRCIYIIIYIYMDITLNYIILYYWILMDMNWVLNVNFLNRGDLQ